MAGKVVQHFGPVRAGALVGVVLAGGEGRRMGPGVPKPLRPLPGVRALKVPVIPDPPDIQRAAQREGRRLGPLAGVLAGMEWARKHHPHAGWILTAPADAPFLPMDLTVRLCGLMHVPEPDVLMVRHGRRREHALAVWSVKLAGDLRRALLEEGLRRVDAFAERYVLAELAWPGGGAPFLNINTPADLTAAARRLAPARPRSRR
jgi:molybdopterin-guanine dinucleotide biosynthesis protein A